MDLVGKTVGHFRIVAEIGRGGMGVVYEAQDLRLPRRAALKFLTDGEPADDESLARFRREAESLSRLSHPHICTIYEVGTHRHRPFIAMERLDGQSLGARLESGPLPVADVIDIGLQVADALGAAHAQGIVHRDVKPGNVFITTQGVVKLLDFGIAKDQHGRAANERASSTATAPGRVRGTPGYMSPEQIRRQTLDGRSDLFSFGALLYRMTCGRGPFDAPSHIETYGRVLHDDPPRPSSLRSGVPPGLELCIATLLRKDPDARYRSTHEAMEALRQAREEASPRDVAIASLAVLPFVNRGAAADDGFGEGLADELITCLARLEGVRIASRPSAFAFSGVDDVQEAGRQLRVGSVLHGTVRRAGERVRIAARLTGVATGSDLWSQTFERDLRDIFDVQEEIATRITSALHWRLQRDAGRPLFRRYTDNADVYRKYLLGRHWLHQQTMEGFTRGRALFEEVLREEPGFAPAEAGLADYCMLVGFFGFCPPMDVWPEARTRAQHAIAMDPSLSAAHTSLALALSQYDWNFAGAEREHQEAIRLSPGDARARYFYGLYLMVMGRLADARQEMARSLELDPLSIQALSALAYVHCYAGEYDEALAACHHTIGVEPAYFETYGCLGLTLIALGRFDEAVSAFDDADRLTGRALPLLSAFLSFALGVAGRRPQAEAFVDGLYAARRARYVPPAYLAVGDLGLGRVDAAFERLEEAYATRDATLLYLRLLPVFAGLRDDPRYEALCRRLALPVPSVGVAAGTSGTTRPAALARHAPAGA